MIVAKLWPRHGIPVKCAHVVASSQLNTLFLLCCTIFQLELIDQPFNDTSPHDIALTEGRLPREDAPFASTVRIDQHWGGD